MRFLPLTLAILVLPAVAQSPAELTKQRNAAVAQTKSSDPEERIAGARELGNLGEGALPAIRDLLRLLNDEEPSVRIAAIETLPNLGERAERDALPELVKRCKRQGSEPTDEQLSLADALVRLGSTSRAKQSAIKDLLNTAKPPLRFHLLNALSKAGSDQVELAEACLSNADDATLIGEIEISRAALEAYMSLTDKLTPEERRDRYGRFLIERCRKVKPFLRRPFLKPLGLALSGDPLLFPDIREVLKADKQWYQHQLDGIMSGMKERAQPLASAFEDCLADPEVAPYAITCLVNIGPTAMSSIVKGAESSSVDVRTTAVRGMGTMRSHAREVIPPLLKALKDPEIDLRRLALESIDALAEDGMLAQDGLRPFLKDPEIADRVQALLDKFAGYRELK